MTLRQPSWFFRAIILGAQGVYYNLFCTSLYFPIFILSLKMWFDRQSFHIYSRLGHVIGLSVIWKKRQFSHSAFESPPFKQFPYPPSSTRCIQEIEGGRLPEWSSKPAPQIAIDYWRLAPDAKLLDVIYAVRSDESTHRFVNHSLANLDTNTDINPFALREPDMHLKGKKVE